MTQKKWIAAGIAGLALILIAAVAIVAVSGSRTLQIHTMTTDAVFLEKSADAERPEVYMVKLRCNLTGKQEVYELGLAGDDARQFLLYDSIFTDQDYMMVRLLVEVPRSHAKKQGLLTAGELLDVERVLGDKELVERYGKVLSVQAQ